MPPAHSHSAASHTLPGEACTSQPSSDLRWYPRFLAYGGSGAQPLPGASAGVPAAPAVAAEQHMQASAHSAAPPEEPAVHVAHESAHQAADAHQDAAVKHPFEDLEILPEIKHALELAADKNPAWTADGIHMLTDKLAGAYGPRVFDFLAKEQFNFIIGVPNVHSRAAA